MVSIVDALRDADLFGGLPTFRDLTSWGSWLVFLRAVHGLPMDAEDLDVFRRHTGRTAPREGGYPEACAVVGRQSGKSRIAALVCAFEAMIGAERGTFAVLVAQDERAVKRALFEYVREPFREVSAFSSKLVRETTDTLELSSGVSLVCYPCRPQALRGIRACVAVVDELAFFVTSEGRPNDREMLRALRPCLATTGGRLLILSSPYASTGALFDLHKQHFAREGSATLIWQGSAAQMNPLLPADYLQRMEQDDPQAYRSEVLGEFRAGIAALFDPDAIDAVVARGVRERLPVDGTAYRAFTDPSGGRSDAWTCAVGHREGDLAVVDAVRKWAAPFNPAGVASELAAFLRPFRVHEVTGDRYGGEFPRDLLRGHRIEYRVSETTASENYLGLLPAVNAAGVLLPDVPELLRELRGLERRRGTSGKDRVDHRPGSHDDLAASVAGLVSLLPRRAPAVAVMPAGSKIAARPWAEPRSSVWRQGARQFFGDGLPREESIESYLRRTKR